MAGAERGRELAVVSIATVQEEAIKCNHKHRFSQARTLKLAEFPSGQCDHAPILDSVGDGQKLMIALPA